MKILQISDTHFSHHIDDEGLVNVLLEQVSIEEKFQQILNHEDLETFDFMVVSGDIVHEGTPEDYKTINDMIKDTFDPLPVYYCLGNHDQKPVFYDGMVLIAGQGNYDHDMVYQDVHFVFMDTAKSQSHSGIYDADQLEWLSQTLDKNNLPKMIFQHHPILGGKYFEGFTIEDAQPVLDILANYPIIGIFTGHTHSPAVNQRGNVLQYTSYALSFGIEKQADGSQFFTDTCGYCVIEYDAIQGLTVAPRIIQPQYRVLKETNPQEMDVLNRSYEK